MYVIVQGISGYGDLYVVRSRTYEDGEHVFGKEVLFTSDSLFDARAAIRELSPWPQVCERFEFDDPAVVETWGWVRDIEAMRTEGRIRAACARLKALAKKGPPRAH